MTELISNDEEVSPEGLVVYVVYKDPKDFPGKYVVRSQKAWVGVVLVMSLPIYVGDSIDGARAVIPKGLYRLDRSRHDDPSIVESWF